MLDGGTRTSPSLVGNQTRRISNVAHRVPHRSAAPCPLSKGPFVTVTALSSIVIAGLSSRSF
jgi:hypothetical protein